VHEYLFDHDGIFDAGENLPRERSGKGTLSTHWLIGWRLTFCGTVRRAEKDNSLLSAQA